MGAPPVQPAMDAMMREMGSRTGLAAAALLACMALVPMGIQAQEQFQFVVAARDANGNAVTDLQREEVVMSEGGVANEIVKIEPYHLPVKLTIAIDNGILSSDSLGHVRSGLEGLIKALPPEVEVAVISMAPQPRTVQPYTSDHLKAIKGVNAIAPEQATPRFVDTLVEYSKRLKEEF